MMEHSLDPSAFQEFIGLQVTGEWNVETLKEWSNLRWVAEGWDWAEVVRPKNWEFIFNVVPSET